MEFKLRWTHMGELTSSRNTSQSLLLVCLGMPY